MPSHPRFIICVFDGLRRDMITTDLAPNLSRFLTGGVDFPSSRSVYPSVTRVNAAALGSGSMPGRTGIIANKFFDPKVFSDRGIHTGKYDDMTSAEAAYGGRFVTAATLGDVLAENGYRMAVVSTGSAGTTHLVNPRAARHGHVTLCLSDWRLSTPSDYAAHVLERFGPIPPAAKPNIQRIRLQTEMLLDAVLPEIQPTVTIVWFSDPDSTYHRCGIGSPESREAIRHVDAQFGRILAWRDQSDEHDRIQVFVCSDHGQIAARTRIDVRDEMRRAGLGLSAALRDGVDYAGSAGYYGAISVRGGDTRRMQALVDWLHDQPWCGHVFTPGGDGLRGGIEGTLDRALLMVEHDRTPELYYAMRADDDANDWGLTGGCFYASSEIPEGGGTHGGFHRAEMNNLLGAQGSLFKQGYASAWPASHSDITPTILRALDLAAPETMTGRVLAEALDATSSEPPEPQDRECTVETSDRRQCLRFWRVGGTSYLDHGWVETPRR